MPQEASVAKHYTLGNLLVAIEAGIGSLGKSRDTVSVNDLAPVDEFHIGGRAASEHFLDQFAISDATHVLDVGCGLGGGARFVADRYGARVTGIDLTPEFVETGNALCTWVGLDDRVALHRGSALDMPFDDSSFDAAYMMHVGMNIADKKALVGEVARVLKPGSVFGIYDVMLNGDGDVTYPVPWASSDADCALAPPETYRSAFTSCGMDIEAECNRHGFAVDFFQKLTSHIAEHGPPPLGLHMLLGDTRTEKLQNMVANLAAGRIAPVEIIARKPR